MRREWGRLHSSWQTMTYEYFCPNCSHNWEESQSITADSSTLCPNCKKNTAQKMISGGYCHLFKGNDKKFYTTFDRSDNHV